MSEQQRNPPQPVLRKPLPPTPFANYPSSQRPSTPPKSYPHYQPPGLGETQVDRYTSRGSNIRLNSPDKGSPTRRPLGARPLPSQQVTNENIPPSSTNLQTTEDGDASRRWSVPDRKPAIWAPRLEVPDEPTVPLESTSAGSQGSDDHDNHPESSPAPTTTITVIRRDATSGVQWNVGSINVESRRHTLALLQPVNVTLTSPGYSRFSRIPESSSTGHSVSPISPSSGSPSKDFFFKRRIAFRPLPEQHRPSLQQVRANSGDFLSDITHTPAKKIRQVYSFTSPWQGVCTFNNGVDGRSLKCRHSLPSHASTEPDAGVNTAELRFNLPWAVLRSRDANRLPGIEAEKLPIPQLLAKTPKEQWRRSVQTFRHKSWTSRPHASTISEGQPPLLVAEPVAEEDSEDENRLSLKLGRERAGGGFKGNSAKLGKLILEDEGLKMCDLTVAACIGVWWQHYMEST